MADEGYPHTFQIGDAVLATVGQEGAVVPGVITAEEDGKYQVSLSQPWVDDSGTETSTVLLAASEVEPVLDGNARPELTG